MASSAEFTWLELEKNFPIRTVDGSATNRARLYIRPVDGLSLRIKVDGDRVLWLTGGRQLNHCRPVQRHLEQLSLRTIDEQQKVVVHDCSDIVVTATAQIM